MTTDKRDAVQPVADTIYDYVRDQGEAEFKARDLAEVVVAALRDRPLDDLGSVEASDRALDQAARADTPTPTNG